MLLNRTVTATGSDRDEELSGVVLVLGWLIAALVIVGFFALAVVIVNGAFGTETRTTMMAKVHAADVRKPSKSATRYVYFTLEANGKRWEANERLEYPSSCAAVVRNVEKPIWLKTTKGFFFGEWRTTSGMVTFCE